MRNLTIETCTQILDNATNVVVLTGAGISTESGIKDFRSKKGIYEQAPEYILSLDYFYNKPKEFYQFAFKNLYHPEAVPNIGHQIIAEWEKAGKVTSIITQNIDGLHQKAGSKNVIEFHGTMKTASCLNCDKRYSADEMVNRLHEMDDFYICSFCETEHARDRYIKPDVVLFGDAGEWFTEDGFQTILQMIERADCLLVMGSSLKVTPFSMFPQYRGIGVPLIIINKGDTPYDDKSNTFVIHDSIGKTLSYMKKNILF